MLATFFLMVALFSGGAMAGAEAAKASMNNPINKPSIKSTAPVDYDNHDIEGLVNPSHQ